MSAALHQATGFISAAGRQVSTMSSYAPAASFPFLGIAYLPTHPHLMRSVGLSVAKTLAMAAAAAVPIFALAFGAQISLIARVLGPELASLSFLGLSAPTWAAGFACAGEAALVAYAGMQYQLRSVRERLFDEVIALQQVKIVPMPPEDPRAAPAGHPADSEKGDTWIHKFFTVVAKGPVSMSSALTRPIMWAATLPLHFIPGLGSIAFCFLNGYAGAIDKHQRYYQRKHMTTAQREAWVAERQTAYQRFGAASTALELIPVLGVAFAFTNTVGAALWAAALEREWQAKHPEVVQVAEQ